MTTSHALRRSVTTGGSAGRWALVAVVAVAEFALAAAAAAEPRLAFTLVIAGALAVMALVAPIAVLAVAVAATFGYMRVGPAAIDMSATDAMTLLGLLAALPFVPWRNKELRAV